MKALALVVMLIAARAMAAPLPGGTLDPTTIPKYTQSLTIPPLMPSVGSNAYSIAARPISQQVLPRGFPPTKLFAYGSTRSCAFSWPAATIQAQQGTRTTITWKNQLVDGRGRFVPHLLPVDPTLHWANPAGPVDTRPTFTSTPGPYRGPVPIVTHLHGAHVDPESDGYPEAWYLPDATNVQACIGASSPSCFFTRGSNYGNAPGFYPRDGEATFVYRNDQRGATLWYHDHVLGMTRANVYAGLAGFYLLRDSYEQGLRLPGPYGKYEIPLIIQDRSFNEDGSLFFPDSRVFFDGFPGPYLPVGGSDISPIWNPEFFGNVMTVNGKPWPKLNVEPRKYRFRFLNGCDSRWLVVQFGNRSLRANGLKFTIIGTEGGLIKGKPVAVEQLRLSPAERYDVIVDFSRFAPGTRIVLMNVGPDEPFGGFVDPAVASDPGTTGQVMAFDVVKPKGTDSSVLPAFLNPPPDGFAPESVDRRRTLTITEFDSVVDPDGPSEAQLGDAFGPLAWMEPITENIKQFTTEQWTIVNRTQDAHPIHLHQTQFQVVSRAPIDLAGYDAALEACNPNGPMPAEADATGPSCPPNPEAFVNGPVEPPFAWEAGPKDTLQTTPGWITRLNAYFDIPGLYVWHCHIISHEDNEMMRPLCVSRDPERPICKP